MAAVICGTPTLARRASQIGNWMSESVVESKFKIFENVSTVYGPGYIFAIRPDCYVVRLGNWQLAQGQSPTCYLQEESLTSIPGALISSLLL